MDSTSRTTAARQQRSPLLTKLRAVGSARPATAPAHASSPASLAKTAAKASAQPLALMRALGAVAFGALVWACLWPLRLVTGAAASFVPPLADIYVFVLIRDLSLHIGRKTIALVQGYTRMPFHLTMAGAELLSFTLFIGFPAYWTSARLYRNDTLVRKHVRYGLADVHLLDIYLLGEHQQPSATSLASDGSTPARVRVGPRGAPSAPRNVPGGSRGAPGSPALCAATAPSLAPPSPAPPAAASWPPPSAAFRLPPVASSSGTSLRLGAAPPLRAGEPPRRQLAPVVVYIQGGGWTICKKDFYAMLGSGLRRHGIMTVIPDYTAFPNGNVKNMVDDIIACIAWTIEHIEEYGGNPNRIYVVGQSAGAHLAAQAVLTELWRHLEQMRLRESNPQLHVDMTKSHSTPALSNLVETSSPWKFSSIKHVLVISGPYDITALFQNMIVEGKHQLSGLVDIFRGRENFERYSPLFLLRRILTTHRRLDVSMHLPPFTLVQGTRDKTIPHQSLVEFERLLRRGGAHGGLMYYEGHSHLESIMEVLEGFTDARMLKDIVRIVRTGTVVQSRESNDSLSWRFRRLLMRVLSPV